jgi:predicted DNA-binding antitoxin AbrB/MazE fold protein
MLIVWAITNYNLHMKKELNLIISMGLFLLAVSSCSTKQKVAELPAGANKAAISTTKPKPKVASHPSFSDNAGRSTLVGASGVSGAPISNIKPVLASAPKPIVVAPAPKQVAIAAPKPPVVKPVEINAKAATMERMPVKTRAENFDIAVGEATSSNFKYKYHVVVGSFKEKTNAVSLQNILLEEGEKGAVVIVNEQTMYRVILGSFDEYKEAHTRISRMGDRFIDAWVLVQAK